MRARSSQTQVQLDPSGRLGSLHLPGVESHTLAVALLFQKWFQTASCAGVQPGDEEQDARRKLRPGEPRRFIPGQHRHRNRQLSTSNDSSTELSAEEEAAIEAEIAAQSDVWSSSGVKLMLVSDFAGIFLLWAATATCMLLVAAFHYSKKQRGELAAKTKDKIRQATRRTPAVRAAGAHMGTQSHAANAVIGSDSATESARV